MACTRHRLREPWRTYRLVCDAGRRQRGHPTGSAARHKPDGCVDGLPCATVWINNRRSAVVLMCLAPGWGGTTTVSKCS